MFLVRSEEPNVEMQNLLFNWFGRNGFDAIPVALVPFISDVIRLKNAELIKVEFSTSLVT